MGRTDWLHGWSRLGNSAMLMGTGVHCVGCGKFYGITSVVFDDDWEEPSLEPEWPFDEDSCPVCTLIFERDENPTWPRGKVRPLP